LKNVPSRSVSSCGGAQIVFVCTNWGGPGASASSGATSLVVGRGLGGGGALRPRRSPDQETALGVDRNP
jgi:hypothetical protein